MSALSSFNTETVDCRRKGVHGAVLRCADVRGDDEGCFVVGIAVPTATHTTLREFFSASLPEP